MAFNFRLTFDSFRANNPIGNEGLGNRAPTAVDDTARIPNNDPTSVDVLANDSDPDGDDLTLVEVFDVVGGSASISNGEVTFTPTSDSEGSFQYTVEDDNGATSTASVELDLFTPTAPENQAPGIATSTIDFQENAQPGDELGVIDASDPDGTVESLTISGAGNVADYIDVADNGIVTLTQAGADDAEFNDFETEPNSFSVDVTATDDDGVSVTSGLTFNVTDDTSNGDTGGGDTGGGDTGGGDTGGGDTGGGDTGGGDTGGGDTGGGDTGGGDTGGGDTGGGDTGGGDTGGGDTGGVDSPQDVADDGTFDASGGNVEFDIVSGNFAATIENFDDGDVLDGFDGASVTVVNTDGMDNQVQVEFRDNDAGTNAEITLNGLSETQDGGLFNADSINTVFGDGALI